MGFIKKHKKFVIITSVIFSIILISIILLFTLFSLKDVSLNFKTETSALSEQVQQQIVAETKREGVYTVLFANKKTIIKNLEKKFPYLKIVNIETVIPSSFVIHCVEREEFYAIESNEKVYYLDEDFKILKIEEENFIKTDCNAVLLNIEDLNLNIENAEGGQFLSVGSSGTNTEGETLANQSQKVITSLLAAFELNNRNISIVRASFQSFRIEYKLDNNDAWKVCLSIIDNIGFETEIEEADVNLAAKIGLMFNAIANFTLNDPEILLSDNILIISKEGMVILKPK